MQLKSLNKHGTMSVLSKTNNMILKLIMLYVERMVRKTRGMKSQDDWISVYFHLMNLEFLNNTKQHDK